jgi:hypothetical protein
VHELESPLTISLYPLQRQSFVTLGNQARNETKHISFRSSSEGKIARAEKREGGSRWSCPLLRRMFTFYGFTLWRPD